MIIEELSEGVLTLTFMHEKPQNPFGDYMQDLLFDALRRADENPAVKSIILTGGMDRSFCVGGDFSEIVDMLTDYDHVHRLLHKILELYKAILRFSKPMIAAIDHHAIGLGFQMAILADYRIASNRAKFLMPEVKNGVACSLGGILIEHLVNRVEMMYICYECKPLPIDYMNKIGLVNEVVPANDLLKVAYEKAASMAAYSYVSFCNTKRVNNNRFIRAIDEDGQAVIDSHHLTFSGLVHKDYMRKILKRTH